MGIKAKKSLGQNFLKSDKAVKEIIEAGSLTPGDIVLEIGPGEGVLTEKLLLAGVKVIAIEKDDRLIIPLNTRFQSEIAAGKLTIIHGDVLDFVQKDTISPLVKAILGSKYKLIANIPYYITGEIIERFNTIKESPILMVLLVQKEVAERIIARDGKESILSIAVKMYGQPKIISIVPRGAFSPAPKVDSAVIKIDNIQHFGTSKSEKEFFDILHAAFAHKRKLVLSNIKNLPDNLYKKTYKILSTNAESNARAEDISIHIWKKVI